MMINNVRAHIDHMALAQVERNEAMATKLERLEEQFALLASQHEASMNALAKKVFRRGIIAVCVAFALGVASGLAAAQAMLRRRLAATQSA